jgi:ornithine cyclodeaminase/alanine dehydrogenase-like protein (mu-crystallin family)
MSEILVLNVADVTSVLTMPVAVDAMRTLCMEEAGGRALSADRIHIAIGGGFFRILPGVLLDRGVLGYKEFHGDSKAFRYTVHIADLETGRPLAVMDASRITAMRTGAMGALALEKLVPVGARSIAFIGAGKEARSALDGLRVVLPHLREGWVYSPTATRRNEFARVANEEFGFELTPVDSGESAVAEAEVVIAATTTRGAVALERKWLRNTAHVSSVASTMVGTREIGVEVWSAADRVVVDTIRLLDESGDAVAAREHGTLRPESVVTLADVVAGNAVARRSASEMTLYKSVGTGLQDIAAAAAVYAKALELGLGERLSDFTHVVT